MNIISIILILSLIYYFSNEHYVYYIKLYCALYFTLIVSVILYLLEQSQNLSWGKSCLRILAIIGLSIVGGILPYMSLTHNSIYASIGYASNPVIIGSLIVCYLNWRSERLR
jgi:hypothetical protein